jgi:hypothetical protein
MSTSYETFTPVLPAHWERKIGVVPIVEDEITTWDEDIFSAEWRPNNEPAGRGWWIWIDGGKGLSTWQCTLVEPVELDEDGNLLYPHRKLMRDFVNTAAEVQAWLDRAVIVAAKCVQQQDEDKDK